MPGSTQVVEKLWNSIIEIQKKLKEIESYEQDLHWKCSQEAELNLENTKIFEKIGRLYVPISNAQFYHNKSQKPEKLQLVGLKQRLTEKLRNCESELNEMMEDDPLYCLKRLVARTKNLSQMLMVSDRDNWLVINNTTPCELQRGPTCGLVSVVVAARTLATTGNDDTPVVTTSVEEVLRVTRELGYTAQGEMFSAEWLAEVARVIIPHKKISLATGDTMMDTLWLVEHLSAGGLILVPYDCAANSSVCMENGHKAHWGIVTGVAVPTSHQPVSHSVQLFDNHFKFNTANKEIISAATECSSAKVKVIMRQSKTLELEFYNRDRLLQSCDNLRQVATKRLDGTYIVPKEGIDNSLRNKIILIK